MKTLFNLVVFLFASVAYGQDSSVNLQIRDQLNSGHDTAILHFPVSVKRFYEKTNFSAAWIKPQHEAGKTWEAMLLLDCVLQFGLTYSDFHPDELSYDSLRNMMNEPEKVDDQQQATFDIVLTDALITLINHLHYGKFNPEFTRTVIDNDKLKKFNAESELIRAMGEKDFRSALLIVQPKVKAYKDLQSYMRLIKGQYVGDCYEVPESEVRKVAINMERLRWADFSTDSYIHVNIPSYSLSLHQPDTTYEFKVIVGKPETKSPVLQSALGYFTTAPDWKVPSKIFIRELLPQALKNIKYFEEHHYSVYDKQGNYVEINSVRLKEIKANPERYSVRQSSGFDNSLGAVVFRFPNDFDVYLHDSPQQKLFDRDVRSLSHGCIRVQKAKELAALLLKYDGAGARIPEMSEAMDAYQRKNFILKTPVPIKITYLTCTIKDGLPIFHKDIYNLDENLENALYNINQRLVLR